MTEGFIPPHGGYQKLLFYQKAEIVYDATVYFCNRFIDKRSRTHDQMIQAATSKETEQVAWMSILCPTNHTYIEGCVLNLGFL